MNEIKKICVIGSGVMGSAIAAQIANAGLKVLLLDMPSKNNGENPNQIVIDAINRMYSTTPAPLSHPSRVKFIAIGNLRDDLHKIKECDLVIEAIIEKIDIKRDLYQKIVQFVNTDTIIASNTSTLQRAELIVGMNDNMKANFVIMHFFNPPRYMRLVELIASPNITQETLLRITNFLECKLGKAVVKCNDTPGFIANRVGCFLMEITLCYAIQYKIDIEIIDYIYHKYLFLPKTGIFGLYDLIGIDTMKLIVESLVNSLGDKDQLTEIHKFDAKVIDKMINDKNTGRKSGSGFYKKEGTQIQVLDLSSMQYRDIIVVSQDFTNISDLLSKQNAISEMFSKILKEFISYISSLIPSVTSEIEDIDLAIILGYGWKYGPFELFTKLIKDNKNEHLISTYQFKQKSLSVLGEHKSKTLIENSSAILREMREGLCISFTSKMNMLNHDIFYLMIAAVDLAEANNKALYIYSDSKNFSVGADLKIFAHYANSKDYQSIEKFLILGQTTMQKLKFSTSPVISAASGFALGGGCEILLHSHNVIAHQNLIAGFAEIGVGLIPGWGGLKEMIVRSNGERSKVVQGIKNIITENRTSSADYFAQDYMIELNINMNTDHLFTEMLKINKKVDRGSSEHNLITIEPFDIEQDLQLIPFTHSAATLRVANMLQRLSNTCLSENDILSFEREVFMNLISMSDTLDMINKVIR